MKNILISAEDQKYLLNKFEEAKVLVRSLDIPIAKDENLGSLSYFDSAAMLGGCGRKANGRFVIRVSTQLIKFGERKVMNTLIHELLHTCYDCFNHGSLWQHYGNKVNTKFGYNIQRTNGDVSPDVAHQVRKERAKYTLVCEKCGAEIYRMKNSDLVKNPHIYTHGCGGNLKLL